MIIINDKNRDKINAEFKAVEGKSRERLCNYDTVVRYIGIIEERVLKDLKGNKKDLNGCRFLVSPFDGTLPRSYKYKANGDYFRVIYLNNKWRLEYAARDTVLDRKHRIEAEYTDEFKASVFKNNENF